ncbi:MAG: Spx/MgsR family RNA polymerase-binding regulatory protein [Parvularculaceae bacterium]
MALTVYALKTCDTCRKAVKALEKGGVDFKVIDVRDNGVTKKQLEKWANAVGWEALLNTRSTTWRGLSDRGKQGVNKKKAVALMAAHPTLIKRPVIEAGDAIYVGWSKQPQAMFIK